MYKQKFSCGSIYDGEIKKKIIIKLIEHQQETTKDNWSSYRATEITKECLSCYNKLHPQILSIKNRYYNRKVRKLFETNILVVRYGLDKVLNRDNGNVVKANAWKLLFGKL